MNTIRSLAFSSRDHGRYWWFKATESEYVPPVFDFLTDAEWDIMAAWYEESETLYAPGTGECNIPAVSMLMGLIMGSNMSRIVQCGHFIGFSTLLMGFMLRRMKHKQALYSIDYDADVTAYTQKWVDSANLGDYVKLVVADSAQPFLPSVAENYLGGKPHLVFIDSSHEHDHTLRELDLWVPNTQPGGFIVMHDVSEFARNFDSKGGGGVKEAVAKHYDQ